ncbi:MAG: hypothetical protein ACPIOQ_75870, partial [Promethearchaeia archaeon]
LPASYEAACHSMSLPQPVPSRGSPLRAHDGQWRRGAGKRHGQGPISLKRNPTSLQHRSSQLSPPAS